MTNDKPIKLISAQAAITLRMILFGTQDSIYRLPAVDRLAAQKQLDHLLYELGIGSMEVK